MRGLRQNLLLLVVLSIALVACFQPAGSSLEPTGIDIAEMTRMAPTATPTVTPEASPTLPPTAVPTEIPPTPIPTDPPTALPTEIPPTDPPTEPAVQNTDPTQVATVEPTIPPTDVPPPTPTSSLPPTPTALPTDDPCQHTVQVGEWLLKIARQYNLSGEALLAANPWLRGNPDNLQPGDILAIPNCTQPPPPQPEQPQPTTENIVTEPGALPSPIPLSGRVYTVVSGDTLGSIARKFGITVQLLMEANGMTDTLIFSGQQLQIPEPGP